MDRDKLKLIVKNLKLLLILLSLRYILMWMRINTKAQLPSQTTTKYLMTMMGIQTSMNEGQEGSKETFKISKGAS